MYMEGRSKNPELVYVEWPSLESGITPTLVGPSVMMQLWKAVPPQPEVAARQLPIHLDTHLALSEIEMGRLKKDASVEWLKQLRQKYKEQVRSAGPPHQSEQGSALHIHGHAHRPHRRSQPCMPHVCPCAHAHTMCRSHL